MDAQEKKDLERDIDGAIRQGALVAGKLAVVVIVISKNCSSLR